MRNTPDDRTIGLCGVSINLDSLFGCIIVPISSMLRFPIVSSGHGGGSIDSNRLKGRRLC